MSDTLEIFGTEYTGVTGIKATDDNGQTKTYIRPQGNLSITSNADNIDVVSYATASVNVQPQINLQDKTVNSSLNTKIVTADEGYDGLNSVTVNAIGMGTQGTPEATKGTPSGGTVEVTPSVVNSAGYIYGGRLTGTAVTVSASELVSGSETKTANGTYNVTNLASLVVDIPFSTIYTGSGNPSSSTGSNGDIYLKVVS